MNILLIGVFAAIATFVSIMVIELLGITDIKIAAAIGSFIAVIIGTVIGKYVS